MSDLTVNAEAARLQTLVPYQALGLEPAADFDRITALAARVFRVPIALVTLVGEDQQYFKSHHGTDACGSPRDAAFCEHALRLPEGETLVIPDATADERVAGNPLVTGAPHVRFYAGAPLRAPNGSILGTLCLIDTVPRDPLTAAERATLVDLAAVAMETFNLHLTRRHAKQEAAERQRADLALRESEARIRRITAHVPGMIYQFVLRGDGTFHFPFVGEGCREFYGVGPPALHDRPELVLEVLDAEYRRAFLETIGVSAQTLAPWHWEGRYRAPDGSLRWAQGVSLPERLPDGSTLWNGMLIDITARHEAQRQLEDSHALLRAIIDGTEDAVFLKDRESRYLLINPAGAALMGRPAQEIIGKDDAAFFPPASAGNTRARDLRILETGLSSTHEDRDVVAGVPRTFLTTKSPFRDAAGHLVGVIGIARDITPQRLAAEALREAKEEAEKANAAKSDFLSRMSHELRTPLNAILGFGQLLELGSLTTQQGESVEHILRAGRHLLNLIDDVLVLSRIEAGRMRLSLEPVSLAEVARECLSLVGRLALDRRVVCEDPDLLVCAGCEVHVQADRQRLRQVLLNLLSNAVKYNREGGRVRFNCREIRPPAAKVGDGGEPDPGRVRVEVSDTGMGLSESEVGLLFTPFERLRAECGTTEGTGLGLALSKSLVEAMNGRIGVDSVPGEGCTFWVELPMASPVPKPVAGKGWRLPSGGPLVAGRAGTILYIEDNLSNLRLIESLLGREENLTLLSAQQGTLGIDIARARLPDLILLDLHLPDLPGWEVLARLRADAETRDIPVIVISADATPHRVERLRAAGAQDYLTKPIDVRELLRALCAYLPAAPAEVVGAGA